MGGKQTWQGKHIYLYLAALIISSSIVAGCATLKTWKGRRQAEHHFLRAQELLAQGDYQGSLNENEKVLSTAERPHGDKALFNIGLIHAHYGNTKRNYQRSLEYFKRLLADYPQSSHAEEAKIWIFMLEDILSYDSKIKELKRHVRDLRQRLELSREVDIQLEQKKKKLKLFKK